MSRLKTLVFSHKRRLQLDAFIKSYFFNCDDWKRPLIYSKDCSRLKKGEFKKDVIKAIDGYEYVLFCVDDLIFKDSFSIHDIKNLLGTFKEALGFSLCLGTNTDFCYMRDCDQKLPKGLDKKILLYKWTDADLDFAYPMSLSGFAYRTEDVLPLMEGSSFDCPNSLEVALHRKRFKPGKNFMLAYKESVAFCAPFNKVQTKFPNNRSMWYTPEFFDTLYDNGQRIDWMKYQGIETNSVHQAVELHTRGE